MPSLASRPTIATTATLIASNTVSDSSNAADYRAVSFLIKNIDGATVFLGGSGVTTANGFQWSPADGVLTIDLEPGESLYGVVASGTNVLHALQVGR